MSNTMFSPSFSVMKASINIAALLQKAITEEELSVNSEQGNGIPAAISLDDSNELQVWQQDEAPGLQRTSYQDNPKRISIEAQRKKAHDKQRRQQLRVALATRETREVSYRPRATFFKKNESIPFLSTPYTLTSAAVAKGSFVGLRGCDSKSNLVMIDNLYEQGFKLIQWDGIDPQLLIDNEEHIYAVLAGRPKCTDWDSVIDQMELAFADARSEGWRTKSFSGDSIACRRGLFPKLYTGVSHGGGSMAPGNIQPGSPSAQRIVEKLQHDLSITRIAGFQSSCLGFYAPKLFAELEGKLNSIYKEHPKLRRNFKNSVLPAISFNLGPQTVCLPHKDYANIPYGFCPITSGGQFDHHTGGHLVLWEPKLIVEFPRGATILIPSAIITHSNTPIQPGETRYSLTQYCAGGLLRWAAYGFCTKKSLLGTCAGTKQIAEVEGQGGQRWKWALSLFSKASQLAADRQRVFELT